MLFGKVGEMGRYTGASFGFAGWTDHKTVPPHRTTTTNLNRLRKPTPYQHAGTIHYAFVVLSEAVYGWPITDDAGRIHDHIIRKEETRE